MFSVIPKLSSFLSATFPVMPQGRRSATKRWRARPMPICICIDDNRRTSSSRHGSRFWIPVHVRKPSYGTSLEPASSERCRRAADLRDKRPSPRVSRLSVHASGCERSRDTTARENSSLSPKWTPLVAARTFESMIRGLWTDWLRYGQDFDLMELGSQYVSELFASFRAGKG